MTEATCSPGEQAGTIVASEEDESRKARFPREGGWLPGLGQARIGELRQGDAAEVGPQMSQTVEAVPSGTFYIHSFDGRLLAEYNLLGQLVRDYVYFGGHLVAEYRNDTLYYYASDLIGSTRIVTDYAGNVVYSAAHNPYGGIQKTWVTDFDPEIKFSGKPRDAESELDFFGPRYYDRNQFRLLSPNSVSAGSGFAPASHAWNAYSYPGNHPWAETYVVAGWMVSATNIEAVIPYRPLKPEPELPWWTVSYPWVTRAEDSLWVLIKSSGEKRGLLAIGIEPGWYSLRKRMDKADEAWKNWMKTAEPKDMQAFITAKEKEEDAMWLYVSKYEYGSDPVMDAYLANYGMSQDPDNPLSFWNPCYVMFHLFYSDI